jgi:hypothetical protein
VSRILFVMLHPGFIRYYDGALQALADAGHEVHVAFEISRDKLSENVLARRLAAASPRITCGTTPARVESVREFLVRGDRTATRSGGRRAGGTSEQAWESLATTVRLMLDYLRFFEPAFAASVKLRDRAAKRLPHGYVPVLRAIGTAAPPLRRACAAWLRIIEEAIPTSSRVLEFVRRQRPDLLLLTPLIELGSQQVDYVKAARQLGVRSALCVASWDNLTSKGLIRVVPDHVVVWNEAQKTEAVTLHGVAPERVVITGAQVFDRWFDAKPSRDRQTFCREMGLDPSRPFVLYVGSSMFIAPDEVPFVERWLARLRRSDDPAVASLGVLLRPHPANARQWRTFDVAEWGNVAVWPPIGSDPNGPDVQRDYFDSMFHSAAVVGINTSAQIEAGIVGRPVFTIRDAEFAHSQAGTLHFHHLVDPGAGLVHDAATLEDHAAQLAAVLRAPDSGAANHRFVRAFIRPFGEATPAAPIFADAIGRLAALRQPPPTPSSWRVLRPVVFVAARVARRLAEDRPLWVYPLRPLVAAIVWAGAGVYWTRTAVRQQVRPRMKQMRRTAHHARYEAARALEKRWKRAQRSAKRVLAAAHSAARKG